MKIAALSLFVVALLAAGCGSSSSTTTISSSEALEARLELVAKKMRHSPRTIAYEKALKALDANEDLPELRRHIEDLLPRMTAYTRFVRSLNFPSCELPVQHRLAGLLDKSEAMTRASIPVLETGDRDLAFAYLEKVHEVTQEESDALERFQRTFEEGDDVTC